MQLMCQFIYLHIARRQPAFFQIISLIKGVVCVQFKKTAISLPYALRNAPQKSISNTIVRVLWVVGLNLQLGWLITQDLFSIIAGRSDINRYLAATYFIACFFVFVICKMYCNQSTNTKMKFFMLSGMCLIQIEVHSIYLNVAVKRGLLINIIMSSVATFAHIEFAFLFGYAAFCVSSVGNIWKWDDISPDNVFFKVVMFCQNMLLGVGMFIHTCVFYYMTLHDQLSTW